MSQRPISSLAMLFGILAIIGVLMPWHAEVTEKPGGVAELTAVLRGFDGEFLGLYTLLLAAAGTALLIWFVAKETSPGISRGLLFGTLLCFMAGIALTVVDYRRDLPTGTTTVGGQVITHGPAFGILMTMIACGLALLMTTISVVSPKTPHDH